MLLPIGDIYADSDRIPAKAASCAQQIIKCLFMTRPLPSLCIVRWSWRSVQWPNVLVMIRDRFRVLGETLSCVVQQPIDDMRSGHVQRFSIQCVRAVV
jgi:hypothetical protein